MSKREIIIIGCGGHAKVVADIAKADSLNIIGFLDDSNCASEKFLNLPVLGKSDAALDIAAKNPNVEFVIAIGCINARKSIAERLRGVKFASLIHPSAVVGSNVEIGEGSVVMANCAINAQARIGAHCIINTGATIEHENIIGDFTHISPSAATGGQTKIGAMSHIGIGACVINNVSICDNVVVGAGACVVGDIVESGTYVGVPAKKIR